MSKLSGGYLLSLDASVPVALDSEIEPVAVATHPALRFQRVCRRDLDAQ
jgi:hypothetical protein